MVVRTRIDELGVRHEDLIEPARIAPSTLYEILSGKGGQEFRRSTLGRLSLALDFPDGTLNAIYRRLVPRNSVLSDPSILETAVAAAIAPDLARINERLDRIENHLGPDFFHGSGGHVSPELSTEAHPYEDPGE
jgi:hypothetical protein